MGQSRSLFCLFYKQLTVNMFIKCCRGWIRTLVLWYRKRPLCQLRHNHCPQRLRLCLTSNDCKVVGSNPATAKGRKDKNKLKRRGGHLKAFFWDWIFFSVLTLLLSAAEGQRPKNCLSCCCSWIFCLIFGSIFVLKDFQIKFPSMSRPH